MKPEILAPAGSMEALKAAVSAGADAVYLGGSRFGARAFADNFDESALIEAIEYCHIYGVKVYLTVNTLFRDEEIEELYDYIAPLYEAGLDAVIVQDLGVMYYLYRQFPKLPIHASTQMTITTAYAYDMLKDYGVTRIVPARELSIEEIRELKERSAVPEVEVFVQGALCYCYSGQCLMSSMLGGRSGNRGRCAQTCRLPYCAYDTQGRKLSGDEMYLLSLKDLCGLEMVPELMKAGVDSFKIEGRMKRPEYVAVCVQAYRTIVDAWSAGSCSDKLIDEWKGRMAQVFNRSGFTEGYYQQQNGREMLSKRTPGNTGVVVGIVEDIRKNQLHIRLSEEVFQGDILELSGKISLTCNVNEKKNRQICLNTSKAWELQRGMAVYRKVNAPLMKSLAEYAANDRKLALEGEVHMEIGQPAVFSLSMKNGEQTYRVSAVGNVVEEADNNPLTGETVSDKLGKTGDSRFYFKKLDITMGENIFYSLKGLKELRRTALAMLKAEVCDRGRRFPEKKMFFTADDRLAEALVENNPHKDSGICAMVSDKAQMKLLSEDERINALYLDLQYFAKEVIIEAADSLGEKKKIYIALPPVFGKRFMQEVVDIVELAEAKGLGLVIRNVDGLAYIRQRGFVGPVVTDYSLYAMNGYAAAFILEQLPQARITFPVELNGRQLSKLPFIRNSGEIVVYGYQQLMVSAQCIANTVEGCGRKNQTLVLKDRYHKDFYVQSICKYCYSLYYNGTPTVLFDESRKFPGADTAQRLHFTRENGEEVQRVMNAFFGGTGLVGPKTRGHYNRGVE
ncbi:MAG: U32 family peptidase [Clostridium sp.]|nr:U32 family peptidase [Clostridium sp.]